MWLSKTGNLGIDFIINVASNKFLILTMQIKSTGISLSAYFFHSLFFSLFHLLPCPEIYTCYVFIPRLPPVVYHDVKLLQKVQDSIWITSVYFWLFTRRLDGKGYEMLPYPGYEFSSQCLAVCAKTSMRHQVGNQFHLFHKGLQIAVISFPRPLLQFFETNLAWNMISTQWRKGTEMPNQCPWYIVFLTLNKKLVKQLKESVSSYLSIIITFTLLKYYHKLKILKYI